MSRARRRAAILIAALFLAGAVSALTSVVPDRASAGVRLAYGGTSRWYWKWETHPFAVSGPGVVDIWTTCRPRFSAITQHELLVGTSNASWLRRIRVRCDRQGRWVHRVGIPRNTWLTVLGHAMYSDGHYCYTECATGWTSVYSVP
jgi:hypothetical protein